MTTERQSQPAADEPDAPPDSEAGEPTDSSPAAPAAAPRCSYCGEPFPNERLRALHRGLDHYDELDETEREAFEDAYLEENEDLRSFRLRALAALVVLYFGFLMIYAVVTV
jgi:hypothetical protein